MDSACSKHNHWVIAGYHSRITCNTPAFTVCLTYDASVCLSQWGQALFLTHSHQPSWPLSVSVLYWVSLTCSSHFQIHVQIDLWTSAISVAYSFAQPFMKWQHPASAQCALYIPIAPYAKILLGHFRISSVVAKCGSAACNTKPATTIAKVGRSREATSVHLMLSWCSAASQQ